MTQLVLMLTYTPRLQNTNDPMMSDFVKEEFLRDMLLVMIIIKQRNYYKISL